MAGNVVVCPQHTLSISGLSEECCGWLAAVDSDRMCKSRSYFQARHGEQIIQNQGEYLRL